MDEILFCKATSKAKMSFLARQRMSHIKSAQLYDWYIYLPQLEVYGIESELAVQHYTFTVCDILALCIMEP